MSDHERHALVFGATGLIGWAVVDQLLSRYPAASPFSSVTAISNRPVSDSNSFWTKPDGDHESPTLRLVSGINLGNDDLTAQLRDRVGGDLGRVTHVFYFVFSPLNDDFEQECKLNCDMMRRVVRALGTLAPRLRSFVYAGGTRGYGIYVPNGTFTPPLKESMADELPADYAKTVAYPWFRKILTEASRHANWTWSEICPDAVIGFSPIGSNFSLALHWAQYLSLYARNHGVTTAAATTPRTTVEVPFPGVEAAYDSLFTPVSSNILGRIAIHAALNPEQCGGKVINMLDHAKPTTFRQLWPPIAAWFGLVGVGPSEGKTGKAPGDYIDEYRHIFEINGRAKAVTAGVGVGHKQLDSVGWWLTFDRQLSSERLRAVGFTEERPPIEGWIEAFNKFREAGIIF
ncbi:hypothetical protein BGZ63DRAFT_397180 [Mariannaea sp. PMI_226]|nr:hypothetical protein BGZ63DRAFT_397180 [Mariannaea sp. PMI_226]